MGFFDKLKKIFESEEKQAVKINEGEILNWFENQEEENKKVLGERLDSFYEELGGILKKTGEAIEVLRGVDVSKRKIEDRYKAITEIGKKDYIDALEELIAGLRDKKEEDFSLGHIRKELNKFVKIEVKAKFKATQLIGKEITVVNDLVSSIKKRVNQFLKENETFFLKGKEIKNLRITFEVINENKSEKDKLTSEIRELEEEIKNTKKRTEEVAKEIQKIKESPEFSKEKEVKSLAETKTSELKNLDSEIKILLDKSIFEKKLYLEEDKKKANFIREYLSEPVASLIKDEKMEIINYLKKIKEEVESGAIDLKERKLKKIRDCINSLREIRKKRKELVKEIGELGGQMEENVNEKKIYSLEQEKAQKEREISEKEGLTEKLIEKKNILEEKIIELREKFEEKIHMNNGIEVVWKE